MAPLLLRSEFLIMLNMAPLLLRSEFLIMLNMAPLLLRNFDQEIGGVCKRWNKKFSSIWLFFALKSNCRWIGILETLPIRESFQKFSKARVEPKPKRGFGNSFQPAIDAPQLEPH
ncbi:unnamed protein product [Vicia faba]|uniref:Uncharacterized protein n=1 Tax=Vicia faba TaxID=3906 RepID=A0AAV0YSX4_VICFA|nr:unnamed protein product [Vicia faba]